MSAQAKILSQVLRIQLSGDSVTPSQLLGLSASNHPKKVIEQAAAMQLKKLREQQGNSDFSKPELVAVAELIKRAAKKMLSAQANSTPAASERRTAASEPRTAAGKPRSSTTKPVDVSPDREDPKTELANSDEVYELEDVEIEEAAEWFPHAAASGNPRPITANPITANPMTGNPMTGNRVEAAPAAAGPIVARPLTNAAATEAGPMLVAPASPGIQISADSRPIRRRRSSVMPLVIGSLLVLLVLGGAGGAWYASTAWNDGPQTANNSGASLRENQKAAQVKKDAFDEQLPAAPNVSQAASNDQKLGQSDKGAPATDDAHSPPNQDAIGGTDIKTPSRENEAGMDADPSVANSDPNPIPASTPNPSDPPNSTPDPSDTAIPTDPAIPTDTAMPADAEMPADPAMPADAEMPADPAAATAEMTPDPAVPSQAAGLSSIDLIFALRHLSRALSLAAIEETEAAAKELESAQKRFGEDQSAAPLVELVGALSKSLPESRRAFADRLELINGVGEVAIGDNFLSVVEANQRRVILRFDGQRLEYRPDAVPPPLMLNLLTATTSTQPFDDAARQAFVPALNTNRQADEFKFLNAAIAQAQSAVGEGAAYSRAQLATLEAFVKAEGNFERLWQVRRTLADANPDQNAAAPDSIDKLAVQPDAAWAAYLERAKTDAEWKKGLRLPDGGRSGDAMRAAERAKLDFLAQAWSPTALFPQAADQADERSVAAALFLELENAASYGSFSLVLDRLKTIDLWVGVPDDPDFWNQVSRWLLQAKPDDESLDRWLTKMKTVADAPDNQSSSAMKSGAMILAKSFAVKLRDPQLKKAWMKDLR